MKRNKIAAGALALALGLGAVAPAYAETTVTKTKHTTADSENGVGEFHITEDYREAEDKYVEAFNAYDKAKKALATAKENEAAAKEAYEKALKALNDFEAVYGDNGSYITTLERYKKERFRHIDTYHKAGGQATSGELAAILSDDVDTIGKYVTEVSTEDHIIDKTKAETQAEAVKDIVALNQRIKEFTKTSEWIQNKRANLQAELTRRQGDYNEAQNKRQAAEIAEAKAKKAYDAAKKAFILEGASRVTIRKAEEAGDVTIVVKETTTETTKPVTEKVVEKETETTVTDDSTVADDEISAETKAKLEKAIADAKTQIEAVKFLKENTPKTIEKVVDKLDVLVKDAKATIKASEELLGKKTALNILSTAYAAEEKSKEERAKELTEKLNANTQEIKDTLKANEAELVKEEEENKEDETPAPAPEKEDDKKEDDKKEDSKEEDKKEESKEDDKKEDKKVEKTTKVVKKAGKNAKTGIAGVAGVAGVLAAASVAYAASKKNN